MKNTITLFAGLIFSLSAYCQVGEFKVYPNGLIYSEQTMGKLSHIVDSLNLKYKNCHFNTIFSPQNWIKSKQSLNDINAAIEQYIDMLPTMEGGEQQYEKLKNTITIGQEQFEYRLQAE